MHKQQSGSVEHRIVTERGRANGDKEQQQQQKRNFTSFLERLR